MKKWRELKPLNLAKLIEDKKVEFHFDHLQNPVKYLKDNANSQSGIKGDYHGQVDNEDKREGFGRRIWDDGEI